VQQTTAVSAPVPVAETIAVPATASNPAGVPAPPPIAASIAVPASATVPVPADTTKTAAKAPALAKKKAPGAKPTVDPAHEGVLRAGF
jgi:hypothetical protein